MRTLASAFMATLLLTSIACGEKRQHPDHSDASPIGPKEPAEDVRPVLLDQDYTADADCYSLQPKGCSGDQIRRISEPGEVSIEKILRRSFASHPWAGQRFEQVLRSWPQELLKLASCPRAIYIASTTLRHSHYNSGNESVFLDPAMFAVTADEHATLSGDPDPRLAAFHKAPFRRISLGEKTDRTHLTAGMNEEEQQMLLNSSGILIHELSHACDLQGDSTRNPGAERKALSDQLVKLNDNRVKKYAELYIHAKEEYASEVGAYKLTDFTSDLLNDSAVDYYSYSNQYEHFAMLIQTALMYHYFGVHHHSFYTSSYQEDNERASVALRRDGRRICADQPKAAALKAIGLMPFLTVNVAASLDGCEAEQTEVNMTVSDFLTAHPAFY